MNYQRERKWHIEVVLPSIKKKNTKEIYWPEIKSCLILLILSGIIVWHNLSLSLFALNMLDVGQGRIFVFRKFNTHFGNVFSWLAAFNLLSLVKNGSNFISSKNSVGILPDFFCLSGWLMGIPCLWFAASLWNAMLWLWRLLLPHTLRMLLLFFKSLTNTKLNTSAFHFRI